MSCKAEVSHAACAAQPLPYPSQKELWSALLQRPWLFERSRGQRRSNPPDFRCLRTNAGLWQNSAPQWVRERWDEVDALDVGEKARRGAVSFWVMLPHVALRARMQEHDGWLQPLHEFWMGLWIGGT